MAAPSMASDFIQIRNATFELYLDNRPICTAEFVSPTELVTASHCVVLPLNGPQDKITDHTWSIQTSDGTTVRSYDLTFELLENITYDVATFKLKDSMARFPYVDVAPSDYVPKIGDRVIAAHYPLARNYFMISEGTFTSVVNTPAEMYGKKSFLTSIDGVAPGSSGSGLYALINGTWKLIGTLEGGPPQDEAFNFYSPIAGAYQIAHTLN